VTWDCRTMTRWLKRMTMSNMFIPRVLASVRGVIRHSRDEIDTIMTNDDDDDELMRIQTNNFNLLYLGCHIEYED
jgi:hypothetical protein